MAPPRDPSLPFLGPVVPEGANPYSTFDAFFEVRLGRRGCRRELTVHRTGDCMASPIPRLQDSGRRARRSHQLHRDRLDSPSGGHVSLPARQIMDVQACEARGISVSFGTTTKRRRPTRRSNRLYPPQQLHRREQSHPSPHLCHCTRSLAPREPCNGLVHLSSSRRAILLRRLVGLALSHPLCGLVVMEVCLFGPALIEPAVTAMKIKQRSAH
jgi:hypothetical protein